MRAAALLFAAMASGCSLSPSVYPTLQEQAISLARGELETHGIAFITPSTVTGQEQEKQAVALIFGDVMKRERPGLRVVTLPETLSAVNKAGLADKYKRMYEDYRDTGLFAADELRAVASAAGTRYIAQLQLQGFSQGSKNRLGLFGLRIVDTIYADLRLYLQIWDSRDGSIAWEGMQELRVAVDSPTEEPVMLRRMLERSAHDLVARLP